MLIYQFRKFSAHAACIQLALGRNHCFVGMAADRNNPEMSSVERQ